MPFALVSSLASLRPEPYEESEASNNQGFRRPSKVLGREFCVRVPSILPDEVCFHYPTGSRADFSNKYRDLELHDSSERLTERWPTDRGNIVRDNSPNQDGRVPG